MCGSSSRCVEKRKLAAQTSMVDARIDDVRQESPGLLLQDLFALVSCAAPPNEYLSRVRYGVLQKITGGEINVTLDI